MTEKYNAEGQWEVVPHDVLHALKTEHTALTMWLYLLSKPDGWKIIEKQVRQELGIGENRYKGARKVLRSLGLWETRRIMENGVAQGTKIIIHRSIPRPGGKQHRSVNHTGEDIANTERAANTDLKPLASGIDHLQRDMLEGGGTGEGAPDQGVTQGTPPLPVQQRRPKRNTPLWQNPPSLNDVLAIEASNKVGRVDPYLFFRYYTEEVEKPWHNKQGEPLVSLAGLWSTWQRRAEQRGDPKYISTERRDQVEARRERRLADEAAAAQADAEANARIEVMVAEART